MSTPNNIAVFEKVSYQQFCNDSKNQFLSQQEYDEIALPCRATIGSAGYDFFSPYSFSLGPGETILIPTGIRVWMKADWALFLLPKSGLGFKYRFQLDNTIGLVDSDYYFSDNEGHIMAKITNDSKTDKTVSISKGDKFMQGVFVHYGCAYESSKPTQIRNGGFGSTSK